MVKKPFQLPSHSRTIVASHFHTLHHLRPTFSAFLRKYYPTPCRICRNLLPYSPSKASSPIRGRPCKDATSEFAFFNSSPAIPPRSSLIVPANNSITIIPPTPPHTPNSLFSAANRPLLQHLAPARRRAAAHDWMSNAEEYGIKVKNHFSDPINSQQANTLPTGLNRNN